MVRKTLGTLRVHGSVRHDSNFDVFIHWFPAWKLSERVRAPWIGAAGSALSFGFVWVVVESSVNDVRMSVNIIQRVVDEIIALFLVQCCVRSGASNCADRRIARTF